MTPSAAVFLDLNGDGVRQAGDPPLGGRTVYLDQNGNGALDPGEPSAVTAADGSYTLTGTGAVRQALFPGDSDEGGGLPTRLSSSLAVIPVVAPLFAPAADPRAAFVQAAYRGALGRTPSDAEVQGWLGTGQGDEGIAAGIWRSDEHRLAQVDEYYRAYLHRAADVTGQAGYLQDFRNGMSEEDVATGFLTSSEYAALHLDPSSFVGDLYAVLLGRTRGAGEAPQYEAQVDQLGRSAFVRAFLAQPETRLRAVDGFYVGLLNRQGEMDVPPGQVGERQGWVNTGLSVGDVAVKFLSSPEFVGDAASA